MRDQSLYIFFGSRESDPYVNSICHGIHHENVKEVFIVDIIVDSAQEEERELVLTNLIDKIYKQFNHLKKGDFQPGKGEFRRNVISEAGQKRYTRYLNTLPKTKVKPLIIVYSELKNRVIEIISKQNSLFDITPTIKNYLIDIYSIIIGENYRRIYYFELILTKEKRDYDETELIHNLTVERTYRYDNITEGQFTKGKMLINEKINLEWIRELENEVSHLSASRILTWILLFSSGGLFLLYKFIPTIKTKWDSLEPITFVVFSLAIPVIITFIFGSIYVYFSGKEPPKLTPWGIYSSLKKIKLNQLRG
jgi:hypothetical protein